MTATKITSMRTGVVALILLSLVVVPLLQNTQAQNTTTFTPADKFNIPELNGSVSFSVNGSCSSATMQNNSWSFNDLRLNQSQNIGNLKVSAQNSNITITTYRAFIVLGRSALLRYAVEGQGIQTINFGLNNTKPTPVSEWSVVVGGNVFLSEGKGWNLLPDDTVVLTGQTGNVSVIHYSFNTPDDSNLPFYQQHSIALVTIAVIAVTIMVAVLISVKVRK